MKPFHGSHADVIAPRGRKPTDCLPMELTLRARREPMRRVSRPSCPIKIVPPGPAQIRRRVARLGRAHALGAGGPRRCRRPSSLATPGPNRRRYEPVTHLPTFMWLATVVRSPVIELNCAVAAGIEGPGAPKRPTPGGEPLRPTAAKRRGDFLHNWAVTRGASHSRRRPHCGKPANTTCCCAARQSGRCATPAAQRSESRRSAASGCRLRRMARRSRPVLAALPTCDALVGSAGPDFGTLPHPSSSWNAGGRTCANFDGIGGINASIADLDKMHSFPLRR